MDQRPFTRLFRLFIACVASLTLLLAPLAPTAFAETPGPGTPSSAPGAGAGGGIPVATLADTGRLASNVYDTIWTQITRAVMVAFFNALQIFFGQIAYDAANYIATAGQGEESVFYKKGFGKYLEDAASDAAGGFIGSLSDDSFFRTTGFDLCKPKDLKYMLRLQMSLGNFFPGLNGKFQRPAPKCQFKDIINNWNTFFTTLSNQDVFQNIDVSLNTNSNDVGVSLNIFNRFNAKISAKTLAAQLERQEGGGFKSITNVLSGDVKTPAAVVSESTREAVVRNPNASQLTVVGAMLSTGFQQGALQLLQYSASVFLNTLSSKLLKRVFEQGLRGPLELPARSSVVSADTITTAGKTDSRNANIDLRTPNLFKVTNFEVMADFIACPTANRGTWNCTIDQSLAQAIQSQSEQGAFTVRDALARNFLHPDWRLIPEARVRENTDPQCHTFAYCAGNLRKMRLLRILPVGFEFAANSPENVARCASAQGCVTLREVVDGFARCSASGVSDHENPWCHLVDPNWVVTLPQQQCNITGFGETLLTPQLNQRREECQDVKTCLKRNDRGECVGGYGYCMAENTVYRFGADECPARFATCRNYRTRTGTDISYLRNTLDYGVCNADNVGCSWYATTRDPSTGSWIGTTSTGPRVYFDKTMESCPSGEEGCTKLLAVSYGQPALNLVLNSSFERLSTDLPSRTLNWTWNPARAFSLPVAATGTVSVEGNNSVDLLPAVGSTPSLVQRMAANPGRVYTVSFFARRHDAAVPASDLALTVTQFSDTQYSARIPDGVGSAMARDFRSEGCTAVAAPFNPSVTASSLSFSWTRYECSFLSSSSTRGFELGFAGRNTLVDAVQLEESEFANVYQDGINASLPIVHLKVPPDEFACTGLPTDSAFCNKFAQVCRQSEAGCQGYTDIRAGGPEVPAIVTTNDLCPQSCVGYDEFRKMPSSFDLTRDLDDRFNDPQDPTSTFFIPTTGQTCSQEEVGCEEFTNIEASTAGGEQKASFSYLRSCRKPGPDSKTYFTWEGSDVTGFQLRTWSLIKEATLPAGPMVVLKRSNGDLFFKNPSSCNARSWSTGTDADCRQFYDSDGNPFYRFFSQTILSTPDCTSYRLNITNRADCELTDGTYNAGSGECVYQAYTPASTVCRKEAAGCRGYAGSSAGNVLTVLNESFRITRDGFSNGTLSTEALLVGDRSLRLDAARNFPVETFVGVSSTDADLFRVTFWAKAVTVPSEMEVRAANPDNPTEFNSVATVTLTPDWQRFTVGPFQGVTSTADTLLTFFVPSQPRLQVVFLDEVVMSRIQDVVYLIEESWNTPNECDRTLSGVSVPQAQLGCRAYRSRTNQTVNVHQFSRLCRQEAIGCSAFVDTRNSNDIAEQTFVRGDRPAIGFGDATTTRPADRYVYLIDEPSKRCRVENASCRAFGKPNFFPDRQSIQSFSTMYFKDDITKYDAGLCRPSELFCEEFTTAAGTEYFRDPQNHACEYKEDQDNVVGAPDPTTKFSGWFIKGSTRPCYPSLLVDGHSYNIALRADPQYVGYGGICEAEFNECTEFRDTNDTTDPLHTTGKPYFFLKNEKIDTQTCAGNVDPTRGCILLRDMGDAFLKFRTQASYKKFADRGYTPIVPVDCSQTPADPTCLGLGNDANLIVKTKIDRDCSQWLGCSSGETVLDPASNRYRDICTSLSLCNKASDTPGDIYCSNYVNRSSSTTEPMFSQGSYFDSARYSSRQIGLGARDYTGYSIPNSFLVSDLVNRRVAIDGLPKDQEVGYRYAQDYRLVAAVPMGKANEIAPGSGIFTVPNASQYEAFILTPTASDIANRYRTLALCQHRPTGRIGFFSATDALAHKDLFCFLPVRSDTDSYDFQNLSQKFQLTTAASDPLLTRAYPPPECRAYPEVDSPFAASFVTEWDLTLNPPKAQAKINGYPNVTTCEYGEDCSCSYKRAEYLRSGVSKFYNPFSQNIPPGICQGGPRDGQTCLPTTVFDVQVQSTGGTDAATKRAAEAANASLTCGPIEGGGTCVPFSRISIIRGVFGQCLERDTTRSVGNDLGNNPCLTWNPNPVLFGDKDQYHFNPQAGYSPPENSGSYYCTSIVKPSQIGRLIPGGPFRVPGESTDRFAPGAFTGGNSLPGLMTRVNYQGSKIADDQSGGGSGSHTSDAYYFDGLPLTAFSSPTGPEGALLAQQCTLGGAASVYSIQSNPKTNKLVVDPLSLVLPFPVFRIDTIDQDQDPMGIKLVATGKSILQSHSETFYRINPDFFTMRVNSSTVPLSTADDQLASFSFSPIVNPGGRGRLACGYQDDWVDGLGAVKYTGTGLEEGLAQKDKDWQDKFKEGFDGIMTRGSEDVFANPNNDKPYHMPCVGMTTASSSGCYMKTWEVGYRDEGKDKFKELFGRLENGEIDYDRGPIKGLEDIRHDPALKECTSNKSYFSIRAVFETAADVTHQGDRTDSRDFKKSEVRGPWNFTGFWVTTCAGGVNDTRYIFMYVDVRTTDICRELAETRSVRSHQDAAFTDRIWKDGNFTVPGVATQYDMRYAPFSSALNTKPPGRDPLAQTGSELKGFSKFEQPTFLGAGIYSYFRTQTNPNNKWAYLSNIFARIYRVYRFEETPVGKNDSVCVGGPNKGSICTGDATCSFNGQCRTNKLLPADATDQKFCNGLAGINAGYACNATSRSQDLCHLGPIVRNPDGTAHVLRKACVLNGGDGWTQVSGGYQRSGGGTINAQRAADQGAFVCAGGSVRTNTPGLATSMYCSQLATESAECPTLVQATCEAYPTPRFGGGTPAHGVIRRCRYTATSIPSLAEAQSLGLAGPDGFAPQEAPNCTADQDCRFDEWSFWSDGDVPYNRVKDAWPPAPSETDIQPGYWTTKKVTGSNNLWGPIFSIRSQINLFNNLGGFSPDSWRPCREQEINSAVKSQVGTPTRAGLGACLWSMALDIDSDSAHRDRSNRAYSGDANFNTTDLPGLWTNNDAFLTAIVRYTGEYFFSGSGNFSHWPGVGNAFSNSSPVPAKSADNHYVIYNIAQCEPISKLQDLSFGRCDQGVFNDRFCRKYNVGAVVPGSTNGGFPGDGVEPDASMYSCIAGFSSVTLGEEGGVCRPVSGGDGQPTANCLATSGDPDSNDPDKDNNSCTRGSGYVPRAFLCPNPNDEYCGLLSYDPTDRATGGSLSPNSFYPLPTDVTLGHYTPDFLGFRDLPASTYSYISYKEPRPPAIAAPDLTRCASPGQCGILRTDTMSLNGRSEGVQNIAGGQHKSSITFYAWADHNQMPIRRMLVDWGDNYTQELPDAKIKNHKPFCGVQKECYLPGRIKHTGLTCDTDADCPPAAGSCKSTGYCSKKQNVACADDTDCRVDGSDDTCVVRTLFGNSPEACETNYFEFDHVYNCNANTSSLLPLCARPFGSVPTPSGVPVGACFFGTVHRDVINSGYFAGSVSCSAGGISDCQREWNAYVSAGGAGTVGSYPSGMICVPPTAAVVSEAYCSRDPNRQCSATAPCAAGDTCVETGLAPVGGCWDPTSNSCRFTPRVLVEDNWGWCTGECRNASGGGVLRDNLTRSTTPSQTVPHPFGGCYAGIPLGGSVEEASNQQIRTNKTVLAPADRQIYLMTPGINECGAENPKVGSIENTRRPWNVFQGSIQLRVR